MRPKNDHAVGLEVVREMGLEDYVVAALQPRRDGVKVGDDAPAVLVGALVEALGLDHVVGVDKVVVDVGVGIRRGGAPSPSSFPCRASQ